MRIYDNDLRVLSTEQQALLDDFRKREIVGMVGAVPCRRSLYHEYPNELRRHIHLFPNQFLDSGFFTTPVEAESFGAELQRFIDDSATGERQVIERLRSLFGRLVVGSILGLYNFGHHGAYLFPEFPLGNAFRADYLLIGKNSDGHYFTWIELECPRENPFIGRGAFAKSGRNGINQIQEWRAWIEMNFTTLYSVFIGEKAGHADLPREFSQFDSSRMRYVVVAGRRAHTSQESYARVRRLYDENRIKFIHYDRLIETYYRQIKNPGF